MPGKIERQPLAARPQQLDRPVKAQGPARAAAVANPRSAVSNDFSSQVAATGLNTGSPHVTISAQPDAALWGGGGGRGSDDPAAITALSPGERAAKLAELQTRRDAMQAQILERVQVLEKKWESAPPETKTAALREYMQASQRLDPSTRRTLRGKVENAEDAHRRIDRLLQRREGLPPARRANAEMRARRAELAKELKAARKDEKKNVKEATKVVEDAGLKVELLAVTEQKIDPSAPKAGSDHSLLGMIKSFFSLNWLSSFVGELISRATEEVSDKKSKEREQVLVRDLENQQVQQRLVADREALKHLTTAIRKAQ